MCNSIQQGCPDFFMLKLFFKSKLYSDMHFQITIQTQAKLREV